MRNIVLTTIIAFAFLASLGCTDQKKRLTLIDDGVTGVASTVNTAYADKAITKVDVQSVRPYVDAASKACQAAYAHINDPLFVEFVNIAEATYASLSTQPAVVAAKASAKPVKVTQ
jgi:uncharacterized protein YwlG (UPF0340 family)